MQNLSRVSSETELTPLEDQAQDSRGGESNLAAREIACLLIGVGKRPMDRRR